MSTTTIENHNIKNKSELLEILQHVEKNEIGCLIGLKLIGECLISGSFELADLIEISQSIISIMSKKELNPLSESKKVFIILKNTYEQYFDEDGKKKGDVEEEFDFAEALLYAFHRIVLGWEFSLEKLRELVRLGDKYLSNSYWVEAVQAYSEGKEMLMELFTEDQKQLGSLARLAPLGLGHALFGWYKFKESSQAFQLGLKYFPSFVSLPFDPYSFFRLDSDYELRLKALEQAVEQDPTNADLTFILAFQYHFTNRREESAKLLTMIENSIPVVSLLLDRQERSKSEDPLILKKMPLKEVEKLVERMRDPSEGIGIKNRRYRFKTYKTCFIGSEMVTWIVDNYNVTRGEATAFAQSIMDRNAFRHVVGEHMMSDDYLFFRFQDSILEYCFAPILNEDVLFIKDTKFIKRYAVLYETAFVSFDHRKRVEKVIPFTNDTSIQIIPGSQDNIFQIKVITLEDEIVLSFKCISMRQTENWKKAFLAIQNQ